MSYPKRPFTGFPFDDGEFDRERDFESQLSDIAKRHPEFAEHLNFGGSFPSRRGPRGFHPAGSSSQAPRRRPFGGSSRFDDFCFPDDLDFADQRPTQPDPQTAQQKQSQPQAQPQAQPQPQPSPAPKTEQKVQATQTDPPFESEKPAPRNLQQSNTVDLGQKQEPVVEDRAQRSMSAPPENHQTRFVSSINIPINRDSGDGMGARASAPEPAQPHPQHQQQAGRPTERVIPIHVEGRDEPVLPRHASATYSTPPPQQERLFGRDPAHFTQFVNPDDYRRQQQFQRPSNYQKPPQPQAPQYQQPPQYQEAPQYQPPPQYQQPPQYAQQPAPEPQEAPKPQEEEQQQPEHKPSQIEIIQLIQKDVQELMSKVQNFNGKPRDKEYLYLDEMLTRNLIKLDNVETEGKDNIRQARKEAIKCIEGCIGILEAKAVANAQNEEKNKAVSESGEDKKEGTPVLVEEAKAEPVTAEASAEGAAVEQQAEAAKEEEKSAQKEEVAETPMEVVPEDKSSQNAEAATDSSAKKEKKKGKKKDKSDNPAESADKK